MTWHTEVVDAERLQAFLRAIRSSGGTVTSSRPCHDGYSVEYVTLDE